MVDGQEDEAAEKTVRFDNVEEPTVSVIITGWRSAPYLINCLTSLQAQTHSIPLEVIVTLNEPTSSLLQSLSDQVEGVHVLWRPVNLGFASACNRAADVARGHLLLLLNDDAVVVDGWLETLVEAIGHHKEAGAVGSRILRENGTIQEEGAVIWSDGSTTLQGYGSLPADPPDLRLRRVDYCSAASLLIRRDTWKAVGGMDEGFFPAYYEDVDLCLKIQSQGQTILYQPRSNVIHLGSVSTTLPYRLFLADRNRERIRARWADALSLFDPPGEGNAEAVARASLRGESRTLPLPPPLPVPDEVADAPAATDEDYLRKQTDTLAAYSTSLEEDLQGASAVRQVLEQDMAALHAEIERLHLAVAHRDIQMSDLERQAEVAKTELSNFQQRMSFKMLNRAIQSSKKIPGVRSLYLSVVRRGNDTPGPGQPG